MRMKKGRDRSTVADSPLGTTFAGRESGSETQLGSPQMACYHLPGNCCLSKAP